MNLPEFIPIEYEGMSVITGIILSFAAVGVIAILKWVTDKFQEQDAKIKDVDVRVDHHDTCVDEIRKEMSDGRVQSAEIKGTIQETKTVVERIDGSITEITKTNMDVLKSLIERGS